MDATRLSIAAGGLVRLPWTALLDGSADRYDGLPVTVAGWPVTATEEAEARYCLLTPEPACCGGCLPGDAASCIEVVAAAPVPVDGREMTLRGVFRRLHDDPCGWRYRLDDAVPVPRPMPRRGLSRRGLVAAATLLCLPVAAAAQAPNDAEADARRAAAAAFLAARPTIDCHSHAGRVLRVRQLEGHAPFTPLAGPMRAGGLAVACLAIVSDSPTHRVTPEGRIRAFREPEPGELAAYAERGFARLHALVREQGLRLVRNAADLAAARPADPAVLVAAEGADFLEGDLGPLEEAYRRAALRHLQLTHYRVNALGDIQTEPPVHGGLTEFGAAVIRRCEELGVIVDVAHGTEALVRRAAEVARKPLVLSHTSLTTRPRPWTRRITPDHARIVAGTGGVIGLWPPAGLFPDLPALADGIARMADVVGARHVGLGTDMMGLVGPSALPDYTALPDLAALLLARFTPEETAGILGGNYLRVARSCLAA
ncbi:peptidase M19 [Methylobacterium terrae]|uniref:Peptidase M19 n=1 Tax=Methylobacterium terrae TaxID=2202827 RepID=A0A2U8WSQ9_9HYPH|nr:membrane dipeptidase [Methylobacterium terrae]AWN48538.1 peptidase M19 [Methylobacterium terrae]